MLKMKTILIARIGAIWKSAGSKKAFYALYDSITETYYFKDAAGNTYDIYKIISEDKIIITQWE